MPGALRGGRPGRFALQAAIAALHAEAASYAETDWRQIVQLYDVLLAAWPSPVVALNRAVALALVEGPEAGLAQIQELERDGRLAGYRYLPAAKADLLRRLGRREEAAQAYRAAMALTENSAERDFLGRRIAETGGRPGPGAAAADADAGRAAGAAGRNSLCGTLVTTAKACSGVGETPAGGDSPRPGQGA